MLAIPKQIHTYIEHGETTLHTIFETLVKVIVQEIEDGPSSEYSKKKMKKRRLCCKKLTFDLNMPFNSFAIIDVYEPY